MSVEFTEVHVIGVAILTLTIFYNNFRIFNLTFFLALTEARILCHLNMPESIRMRLFHPLNSLVVTSNMWLIFYSKMDSFQI
jgi:hypothetical protein